MGMVSTQLIHGDCLEVMQGMEPNSIHSIVCDPPYGLSFMGKDWDHGVPGVAFWEAALRVAKPGAMLLAFGGTRTHHRLMVAIEDAGWRLVDVCMWLHAQGFPKGIAIDKAIDKHLGKEREVIGSRKAPGYAKANVQQGEYNRSVYEFAEYGSPATPEAAKWQGWHSALKPAWEPIIMAMKPLDGTFANNALVHGVAGINIDGCRIEADEAYANAHYDLSPGNGLNGWGTGDSDGWAGMWHKRAKPSAQGRWPSNLLLDEEAAAMLDQMSGISQSKASLRGLSGRHDAGDQSNQRIKPYTNTVRGHDDQGGASRFFYCAKASKRDRDEGLEGMELRKVETMNGYVHPSEGRTADKNGGPKANHHPTVKPTALMKYLVRLCCPPGGTVLDPFMGSGSTGKAAVLEGFNFIGIELEAEYLSIAERRIAHALATVEKPAQTQPALLEVS